MRLGFVSFGILVVGIFIWGCAQSNDSVILRSNGTGKGLKGFLEAGQDTYRYAFSGQVLNETTKEPVPTFAIELAGNDPAITAVLNAMGEARGLFHISRLPSHQELEFASLPLIISAQGYEPLIQMVDLGSDCDAMTCPGVRPTAFRLKPVVPPVESTPPQFYPKRLKEILSSKSLPQIFRDLMKLGKFDKATESLLASGRISQEVNAVVFLNTENAGEESIRSVMADFELAPVSGDLVQYASTHPELANAVIAASPLLNYFTPVASALRTEKNAMAGMVASLIDNNLPVQLAAIATNRPKKETTKPQLAMGTLAPLLSQWMGGQPSHIYSNYPLLEEALQNASHREWLSEKRDATQANTVRFLVQYLQPLIQQFNSKGGGELIRLFNEFVSADGLTQLTRLEKSESLQKQLGVLTESLLPLSRGLNSEDRKKLGELLHPILKRSNPGQVIKNIVGRLDSMDVATRQQVVDTIYPSARHWVADIVPAKRLLATQIFGAMADGDFKELQVTQDLKGLNAVMIRGQARDLFKLSLLSNVARVVSLK